MGEREETAEDEMNDSLLKVAELADPQLTVGCSDEILVEAFRQFNLLSPLTPGAKCGQ